MSLRPYHIVLFVRRRAGCHWGRGNTGGRSRRWHRDALIGGGQRTVPFIVAVWVAIVVPAAAPRAARPQEAPLRTRQAQLIPPNCSSSHFRQLIELWKGSVRCMFM